MRTETVGTATCEDQAEQKCRRLSSLLRQK